MDRRILNVLRDLKDLYGDMVFYNFQKTKNLMHDLAPGLHKERIHIAQFLEINGYFRLKHAGHSYSVVRSGLAKSYMGTYGVSEDVVNWVLDIFTDLLGYSEFTNTESILKKDDESQGGADVPADKLNGYERPPSIPGKAEALSAETAHTAVNRETVPGKQAEDIFYERVQPTVLPKKKINPALRIAADMHSVAVTPEGRVISAGPNEYGECNVENWRKVCAVSAGPFFTVGLREDGRVYACGSNKYGQCNVQGWYDIAAISAGARHTVGLRRDGSVIACGQNRNGECNVETWRNVISISAGYMRTYGILKNHKLLVSGELKGKNNSVSHLSNIIDIKNPYPYRVLALKKDGTLSCMSKEDNTKSQIAKWKGIKQISAGPDYFAGLSKAGTVHIPVYYWISSGIELSTANWEDIVAIAAGRFHLLGVKKDGSVIAAMMHPDREMNKGQCRVTNWQLLD